MKIIQGTGVSGGYAIGTPYYYSRESCEKKEYKQSGSAAQEQKNFASAQARVIEILNRESADLLSKGEKTAASLLSSHAELAEDPDFTDEVIRGINDDGLSAVDAVHSAGNIFAGMFEKSGDESLFARGADIRDVASRIEIQLKGCDATQTGITNMPRAGILIADELTPSETITLDRTKVLALVTAKGSPFGHAAIVARSYGIPAVIGADIQFDTSPDKATVIVDGFKGIVIISPDDKTMERYGKMLAEWQHSLDSLNHMRGLEDVTAGGRQIKLYCNISDPDEVGDVLSQDGRGIGLFRSEFLFMNRKEAPSEEEQFGIYKKVLSMMADKEVTIRTLDIGADKAISYLNQGKENNPAMGLRGLRFCLKNPELFRTQLRALYRASIYGKLRIMFPMVTDLQDVLSARRICREVMNELLLENVTFRQNVPVGIMIEVPAAALISEELAKEADFFSIGTNDLTQYTLACDRTEETVKDYFNSNHPAVMKLIDMTIRGAHSAGIKAGICGELASDPEMIKTLIDMGVDELSVSPGCLLALRSKLRE